MMSPPRPCAVIRWFLRPLALLVLLAATLGGLTPRALGQDATTYYVAATSQHIADPFLTAWIDLGGSDRLGMPVTNAGEIDGAITQYFQLGVLRTDADDPNVEMMPAGRDLLDRPDPSSPLRTGRRAPAPREARPFTALRAAPALESVAYDRETGHAVKGTMLRAYEQLGGDAALGSPLSEAYQSGALRVQWFEMGRLESRGGEVALGAVGSELAVLDGADRGRKPRGSLASLDLPTYVGARGAAGAEATTGSENDAGASGPALSPARLRIPAIGIDASIESVGVVDDVMQTPGNPWNVGWYSGFGGPGDGGNTVMAGHRDWAGIGPVVFWALGALGAGNEIYLLDGAGNTATYVVYESFTTAPDADSSGIIGDQGEETLTLITCGGDFSAGEYNLRIVVRARRV